MPVFRPSSVSSKITKMDNEMRSGRNEEEGKTKEIMDRRGAGSGGAGHGGVQ